MISSILHKITQEPALAARAFLSGVILGGLCYIAYFGTMALALCSALQNDYGVSCW